MQDRLAQLAFASESGKRQLDRPHGRGRHRQRQRAVAVDAADQERRRAADRRQRYLAERRAPSQRRKRDIDLTQQIAWSQHVALIAGDEVGDADLLLAAVGLPDRADAVERRRQRDHRSRRQRHAEIAADGRGLPDLERSQKCAAALIDQGGCEPIGRAAERIELRDRAGRGDRELGIADRQRRPFQIGEIDQPPQMSLRLREQPGPAREPSIACRPNGQLRPGWRVGDLLMVFRSMEIRQCLQ